jgi:RNA polymerase sigma-70 factor (ECF subfamily)
MTSDAHDVDAIFEKLFIEHQEPILNYIYRLVGDAARAEELTQDAFVKAYHALPRLRHDANRRAWLYRIATNTAYDHLRRRRLIQWLPLLERDRHPQAAADLATDQGQREATERALTVLPPGYRSVLILYGVMGYSTVEIAEMLGISRGAVKTRLCRARERFRQVYGEED